MRDIFLEEILSQPQRCQLSKNSAPLVKIVPIQLLSRRMAIDEGLQPGKFDKIGKVTLDE